MAQNNSVILLRRNQIFSSQPIHLLVLCHLFIIHNPFIQLQLYERIMYNKKMAQDKEMDGLRREDLIAPEKYNAVVLSHVFSPPCEYRLCKNT